MLATKNAKAVGLEFPTVSMSVNIDLLNYAQRLLDEMRAGEIAALAAEWNEQK